MKQNMPCLNAGISSSVFPSLPDVVDWIKETARQNKATRFQVILSLI
jgi:hypothetical protein